MPNSQCAPKMNTNYKKLTVKKPAFLGSCFSIDDLFKIIREWNMLHPTNKIIHKNTHNIKQIWNLIAAKLNTEDCNTEFCWIKKKLKNTKLANNLIHNFRPEMPSTWHHNNTEWLSTEDIDNVLLQYEEVFSEFTYRGAVPIDFDKVLYTNECVSNDVCKINLSKLSHRGKTKIGIVFNLDPHYKNGSHWIAMFIDINKKILGYWDSYAMDPPTEIISLITRLQKQSSKYFKSPLTIMHTNIRHQYKKSECGMYCIHFITQLLEGNSFNKVYKSIISDDEMNKKRQMFFNKSS